MNCLRRRRLFAAVRGSGYFGSCTMKQIRHERTLGHTQITLETTCSFTRESTGKSVGVSLSLVLTLWRRMLHDMSGYQGRSAMMSKRRFSGNGKIPVARQL